jgi:exopolysaccharide production protein ExoQ
MSSSPSIPANVSSLKPHGNGMAFAVGAFFSFRAVIVLICVRVLGTEPQTGGELGVALNFLLLALVCFHSLGAGCRTFRSMLHLSSIRWVLIFLTFSGCSLLWSGTESMSASIVYWCAMAADVAMVVLLLRAEPVTAVASSLMKGFVYTTCAIALVTWIMPAQSDLRLGDEVYFNANQIGFLCAFAFFLAQYLMRSKDGKWGLAMCFLAVTLLRSLSKTTIAAFALSQGVLLIQDKSMSRRTKILLTIATVLVILLFWGLIEAYYDVYTNAGNQSETLTGRIGIWAYMFDAAMEQPWIGHGFNSVWKIIPAFGEYDVRHAENELLQQFYAYGAAGIVLFAGLYGSLYRQFRRLPRGPLKIFFLSILLFVLVRGLAEAEPFDLLLPLWAIVLISLLANQPRPLSERMEGVATHQQPGHAASGLSAHPPMAWGVSPQE